MGTMKNEKAASNWRQCTKHRGKAFLVTVLLLGTVWPQCCVSQGLVYFNNFGTTSGITNGLTWQLADIGTRFQVALYFAQVGVLNESQFLQLGLPIGIKPLQECSGSFLLSELKV